MSVLERRESYRDSTNSSNGTLGPVARSLVNGNRWLRGFKVYRVPWYLTLVSTNHASSNPGQDVVLATFPLWESGLLLYFLNYECYVFLDLPQPSVARNPTCFAETAVS